jgi:D-3-phosphoglycerate dehydrogenase
LVGTVGGILGRAGVNIGGMQVARDAKGGHALVALSVDSAIPAEVLDDIGAAIDAASVRAVDLPA